MIHKIHLNLALVFGRNLSPKFTVKEILHQSVGGSGNVDATSDARRLQTAGGVNRVAPYVVGKLLPPYDARNQVARMYADPNFPVRPIRGYFSFPEPTDHLLDLQGSQNTINGVCL